MACWLLQELCNNSRPERGAKRKVYSCRPAAHNDVHLQEAVTWFFLGEEGRGCAEPAREPPPGQGAAAAGWPRPLLGTAARPCPRCRRGALRCSLGAAQPGCVSLSVSRTASLGARRGRAGSPPSPPQLPARSPLGRSRTAQPGAGRGRRQRGLQPERGFQPSVKRVLPAAPSVQPITTVYNRYLLAAAELRGEPAAGAGTFPQRASGALAACPGCSSRCSAPARQR